MNVFNRSFQCRRTKVSSLTHSCLVHVPINSSKLPPSKSDQVSFYYQNVRGLRTKTTEFYLAVLSDDSDFYCLTETWLNEFINDCELFPSNYSVIRSDNKPLLSGKSRGGGVLISYKKDFFLADEPIRFNTAMTDALIIKLKIQNSIVVVCVAYISPSSPISEYEAFFDLLNSFLINLPSVKLILCGDFNIPNIQFVPCKISKLFFNFISLNMLTQHNHIPNINGKTLDLVVSGSEIKVEKHAFPLVAEDAYHPSLTWSLYIRSHDEKPMGFNSTQSYDFDNANFYGLYNDLSNCSFDDVLNEYNVNSATSLFYQKFYSIMDRNINKKTFLI